MSRPTDVEISRALNALSTTLRDQRPERLDPGRVRQIVDGAVAHQPKFTVRAGGPESCELRTLEGDQLVATVSLKDGQWSVDRRVRAQGSGWALPQPAHERQTADS